MHHMWLRARWFPFEVTHGHGSLFSTGPRHQPVLNVHFMWHCVSVPTLWICGDAPAIYELKTFGRFSLGWRKSPNFAVIYHVMKEKKATEYLFIGERLFKLFSSLRVPHRPPPRCAWLPKDHDIQQWCHLTSMLAFKFEYHKHFAMVRGNSKVCRWILV